LRTWKIGIMINSISGLQGPILSTTDFLPWFTGPNCLVNKNYELQYT
jgi:hypothetical protein